MVVEFVRGESKYFKEGCDEVGLNLLVCQGHLLLQSLSKTRTTYGLSPKGTTPLLSIIVQDPGVAYFGNSHCQKGLPTPTSWVWL